MVEAQMGFQPTVRSKVKDSWSGYIAAAQAQSLMTHRFDFVLSFVNQNFPHLLEDGEVN